MITMFLTRSVLLFLCASVTAGCAVGPDYHRPDAPLSSHYMGQTAAQGADTPASELATWWQGFDDPLLTRFISLAFEQNLDLAQAAARVTRIPPGHPEGNLEGFANIYAEAGRAIIARRDGSALDSAVSFPGLKEGLEGVAFVDACVRSSARNAAWVKLNL